MDRENFYHWGAGDYGNNTEEEQKLGDKNARSAKNHAIMTRDYANPIRSHSKRTIFAPSRPN